MRKLIVLFLASASMLALTGFSIHKFYVSIYQINYVSDKKMLQITSRIFLDDLNETVQSKSKQKMYLGESSETPEQENRMVEYLLSNLQIRVNGKPVIVEFRSKEVQDNVMICYFRVVGVSSVKSLWVKNRNLFDYVTDQQNIIQTTINGKKNSLLLTIDNPEDTIDL